MSEASERPDPFDVRMRRILADVDTSPGFEARVMQRIAAPRTTPVAQLRARVERGRELARRRLRREAWTNVATAAGIGAAAIALIWSHGPEVAAYVQAALDSGAASHFLTAVALAALGVGLWPLLQRYRPR